MYRLDRFFDTREKRIYLFYLFLFLIMIWTLSVHVILGFRLAFLTNQDGLFSFISQKQLSYSYLARVILQLISISSHSFFKTLGILFFSGTFYEVILIIGIVIGLMKSDAKGCQKGLKWIIGLVMVMLFAVSILGMGAMQMISLQTSISFLNMMGIVLIIGSMISLLIVVSIIYHICMVDYPNALQVEVKIIEEKSI